MKTLQRLALLYVALVVGFLVILSAFGQRIGPAELLVLFVVFVTVAVVSTLRLVRART